MRTPDAPTSWKFSTNFLDGRGIPGSQPVCLQRNRQFGLIRAMDGRTHMLNQETTPTPTDIQQDLRDARALLEQAGSDDDRKKYRKAAEIILLKALRIAPENQE